MIHVSINVKVHTVCSICHLESIAFNVNQDGRGATVSAPYIVWTVVVWNIYITAIRGRGVCAATAYVGIIGLSSRAFSWCNRTVEISHYFSITSCNTTISLVTHNCDS